MEEQSISYFRNLWSSNTKELRDQCENWEPRSVDNTIPEEVRDEIRTSIGLANLLINQKLKQFHGLVDDSEFGTGEKEITCLDLQGFWDMVYNEVEKIQKTFQKLEECENNDWVFVQELKTGLRIESKKKPILAKKAIPSKGHASAARQRLAEAKLKMKAQMAARSKESHVQAMDNKVVKSKQIKLPLSIVFSKEDTEVQNDSRKVSNAIANVENLHISRARKTPSKSKELKKVNLKSPPHNTTEEKENNLNIETKVPKSELAVEVTPSKRLKEVVPLQCVTRSAKKKLLATQNHN